MQADIDRLKEDLRSAAQELTKAILTLPATAIPTTSSTGTIHTIPYSMHPLSSLQLLYPLCLLTPQAVQQQRWAVAEQTSENARLREELNHFTSEAGQGMLDVRLSTLPDSTLRSALCALPTSGLTLPMVNITPPSRRAKEKQRNQTLEELEQQLARVVKGGEQTKTHKASACQRTTP